MSGLVTAWAISVTVGTYALSRAVGKRYPSPLTTPVFFSTPIIIAAMCIARVRVEQYAPAKDIMTSFLGPATVALAVPMYKNGRALVKSLFPCSIGLAVGSLSSMFSAIAIGKLLGLSPAVRASMSLKSVTAPIAIELAGMVRADPALTAALVIATGMTSAMLGSWFMDRLGIVAPLARGLALGTIAHGQGTAQAALEGELQGAVAGVAMGLAAIFTSLVTPALLAHLL
jgi:putative effector of murein hydrolase